MNKSLFKSKRAKTIYTLMTVIIMTGIIGMAAKAQTERRASNIKSKGIFDYDNGTVVVDASDLTYLADEIDLLEETYKKETVKALNKMSTYFMMDNSTTHDQDESNLDPESSVILPFGSIIDGILASQSIPTKKTYTGTLPGKGSATTGNISAAIADSLSLGRAAWVDGKLIIGTGADNKSYYNLGRTEGYNLGYTEGYNLGRTEGYNLGYADGMAGLVNGQISYTTHSHTNRCYESCKVTYDYIYENTTGAGNQCSACGATNTNVVKWSLSHSRCGETGDKTEWIICASCGSGSVQGVGAGSEYRAHNVLICGKENGQIESATIVYP